MNAVEEAIRMWEIYRSGTVGELVNIPEEQWDWRPGAGARSVRELALHVAGSAVGFIDELVAAEPSFMRLRTPEVQQKIAGALGATTTKDQILAALKTTMATGAARLRAIDELLRSGTMKGMGGEQTRVTGVWFAAAHEMYHRGQLATYARSLGLVPAMTQKFG
jgi:uncharacterized damage-inducible protein DinB